MADAAWEKTEKRRAGLSAMTKVQFWTSAHCDMMCLRNCAALRSKNGAAGCETGARCSVNATQVGPKGERRAGCVGQDILAETGPRSDPRDSHALHALARAATKVGDHATAAAALKRAAEYGEREPTRSGFRGGKLWRTERGSSTGVREPQ